MQGDREAEQAESTQREQGPLPKEVGERGQRRLLQYLATGSLGSSFMMGSAPLFLLALGAQPLCHRSAGDTASATRRDSSASS